MSQESESRPGRDRGFVLVIVLLVLVVGALSIPPTLMYMGTGLKAAQVSEKRLLEEYAAEAAVEYSLWQIAYNIDGIVDGLSVENPVAITTLTINGIDVTTVTCRLSSAG